MKKNKISLAVLTAALVFGSHISVYALDANIKTSTNGSVDRSGETIIKTNAELEVDSEKEIKNSDNENSSSSDEKKDNKKSDEKDNDSKIGDEHRSTVALFVKNLLSIADRESRIGDEVKLIAQEQNDSSSISAEAITKVEGKGAFSTFFFGTDYKNLGIIRSELAKTSNRIDKLSKLVASISDNIVVKEELNLQIEALKNDQVRLYSFVNNNESKFSLLGWFVKLFNR